jgi:predicted amidohydrolase
MKIAAAQISCALGDIDGNLRKVRDFSSRAKDASAELIVFPEMADTGYSMPVIKTQATSWTEGAVPKLQEIARTFSIAIISGVSERDDAAIYNSQVFIDANGQVAAKYRKSHLFRVHPVEEDKCFSSGNEFASFALGGLCFGFSICYDLRFPEMYRKLAVENDVKVFINSSAWPFPRVEHLRILALARAIENQSYMVLANRVGTDADVTFCGSSAIIDPYGVILASASTDREELIHAEVSEKVLNSVRSRMMVFDHRRHDLY